MSKLEQLIVAAEEIANNITFSYSDHSIVNLDLQDSSVQTVVFDPPAHVLKISTNIPITVNFNRPITQDEYMIIGAESTLVVSLITNILYVQALQGYTGKVSILVLKR